jgi:hypothetical protein
MKEVHVNLNKNQITVIEKFPLFDNPRQRFIIEADQGGFSCIEKRLDGYYALNFLGSEKISERKLTVNKVREIIKEVVLSREEQQ